MELGASRLAEPLLADDGRAVGPARRDGANAQLEALARATSAAQQASAAALEAAEAAKHAAATLAMAVAALNRDGTSTPPDTPNERDPGSAGASSRALEHLTLPNFPTLPHEESSARRHMPSSSSLHSERSENRIGFFQPDRAHGGASGSASDDTQRGGRNRLVRRDYPFKQSSGSFFMARSGFYNKELRQIALKDSFHVLVDTHLAFLFALVIILYTAIIILFAGFYMLVDNSSESCGLAAPGQPLSFQTAFAFSVRKRRPRRGMAA